MKSGLSLILKVTVLSILVGGGSGVIAAALTGTYLSEYAAQLAEITGPLRLSEERPRALPSKFEEAVALARESAIPASAQVYAPADGSDGAFEPEEALASATVLTSDGWLMTSTGGVVNADLLSTSTIVIGRETYQVEQVVEDTRTEALFAKVSASNLPVTAFGDPLALLPGDALFVAGSRESFITTSLAGFDRTGPLVSVSEEPTRELVLSDLLSAGSVGAPVVNAAGELVGVVINPASSDTTSSVLPLTSVMPAIESVLHEGRVIRPRLGVEVVDLTRAVGFDELKRRGFERGAYIDRVVPASPAADAGLRAGDIILEVSAGIVNGTQSLDEYLMEREPGDSVVLTFDRGGEEQKVTVELGAE